MKMTENGPPVNYHAPIMGARLTPYAESTIMHLVGLDQIDAFLAGRPDCLSNDALRAFAFELANRNWPNATSMARDYPSVSFGTLPQVAFVLSPCSVTVDCHIDFRTGTVLIECCKPGACRGEAHCPTAREIAA